MKEGSVLHQREIESVGMKRGLLIGKVLFC